MLAIENNGDKFSEKKLLEGQKLLATCLQEIAREIGPGMNEKQAAELTKSVLVKHDFGKNWHPPKIRFGINTLKIYSELSEPDVILQKSDIFFLDLGPIIADHECDYGQTFVVGNDPAHVRLRDCSTILFNQVKAKWSQEKLSGQALYQYALEEAAKLGYEFVVKGASGHRLGDFPHQVHFRGNLMDITEPVAANRWILEIQLHDKKINRGAFFEDIL
jgi:methionyl aminopeptidase